MIFIYYIFAALLVYLSYRSFCSGIDYLNYFKHELSKPAYVFAPLASVIVPCKGLDKGLAENLNALLVQNYPSYEVIFVVDDADDRAVPIIEEISRKAIHSTKLVVAPKATHSSQKVENLREAVLNVSDRSQIFVFVDSDARPAKDWLANLIGPLEDEDVGATTGYRWFLSEKPDLASELRSSWNASIASALGPNTDSNFCWGGSMAIRRYLFEYLEMREKWYGTLSDDFAVTTAMRAAGKIIYFVPRALTASIENCSFRGLFEFTNRQMKITRVYATKLWLLSFFASVLFNSVMVLSILISLLFPVMATAWSAATLTLLSVTFFSIGKAWLRCSAVRLALPEHTSGLRRQLIFQLTLWLFTPAIFFVNSIAALLSRKINWRDTRYEMLSPTETRVWRANPT